MNEHIYKKIEIVGTSTKSIGNAISNAVVKASKSVRNLRWFEVVETRGDISGGEGVPIVP